MTPPSATNPDGSVLPAKDRLSAQTPWPGLRAFAEEEQAFFFGRAAETSALFEKVRRTDVVVFYGQSGLGKTSLLQAGLFPELKRCDLLPVRIRLDHGPGAPALARQILDALVAELGRNRVSAPLAWPGETLWEYFHRLDVEFWGPRNRLYTPVLVLDQFEEVFTLGQRDEEAASRVTQLRAELEGLIEDRPPAEVRARLEADPDLASRYEFGRRSVKLLLCLREDFLPHLDTWRVQMPSLLPHRLRLERMTGAQALEVVIRGGGELVTPGVAREIVGFVSSSRRPTGGDAALEDREIEPALLSVVCDELNRRRIERGQDRILPDLLNEERDGIIRGFYARAFEGVEPRIRDWIEDELLTASGYRNRAAMEDALRLGFPAAGFDVLEDRRLLHREERDGVVWLELTHDLLTSPALASRQGRQERLAAEAAAREAAAAALRQAEAEERLAEARERLKTSRAITALFALLLLLAATAFGFALKNQREARRAQAGLESALVEARKASEQADEMAAYAQLSRLLSARTNKLSNEVVGDAALALFESAGQRIEARGGTNTAAGILLELIRGSEAIQESRNSAGADAEPRILAASDRLLALAGVITNRFAGDTNVLMAALSTFALLRLGGEDQSDALWERQIRFKERALEFTWELTRRSPESEELAMEIGLIGLIAVADESGFDVAGISRSSRPRQLLERLVQTELRGFEVTEVRIRLMPGPTKRRQMAYLVAVELAQMANDPVTAVLELRSYVRAGGNLGTEPGNPERAFSVLESLWLAEASLNTAGSSAKSKEPAIELKAPDEHFTDALTALNGDTAGGAANPPSGWWSTYYERGEMGMAYDACLRWVLFLERQTLPEAVEMRIVPRYLEQLAEIDLKMTNAVRALASCDRRGAVSQRDLPLQVLKGRCLLLLGRVDDAKAVYLSHVGEKALAGSEKTWETLVDEDLKGTLGGSIPQGLADDVRAVIAEEAARRGKRDPAAPPAPRPVDR